MTDTELMTRAVALVLAMMRSASTDRVDPRKWWERAKTALETGAAVAGSFPELVSVMARKLEIEATTNATADTVASLSVAVGGEDDFEAFRALCERDAVYVVAMAQAQREEERQEQGTLWSGGAS